MEQKLHTPEGVRDIYNRECAIKLALQKKLNTVLHLYGYQDIQTPTFEYFDVFRKEIGSTSIRDLYKFFDREGNILALRPDIKESFRTVCTGDGCVIVDDFSVCHTDGRFLCSTDGIRWGNGTCSIPFPDGNYLDHRCRNRCDHQKNEQFQEKKIRKIYRSCRKNVISCKWHFFLYILL